MVSEGRSSSRSSGDAPPPSPPPGAEYPPTGGTDADDIADPFTANISPLARILKSKRSEYVRPQSLRFKVATWNVAARPETIRDVRDWLVKGKGIVERFSGVGISDDQRRSGDGGSSNKRREQRESTAEQSPSEDHQGDQKVQDVDHHHEVNDDVITVPFPKEDGETDSERYGLYVLGLQEIVDISSPTEALKPYYDPGPANKWKNAVQQALPSGYELVAESQLVGLLLLIYASPTVATNISSVSNKAVATGFMGYMGNKGAVVTRLVLGQTTSLVFVNCHLASGSDKSSVDRRNWDAAQVASRTKFETVDLEHELISDPVEMIGKEDFAFWFGDLNYRLEDIPGGDVRNVLHRHTLNSFDGTRDQDDPADFTQAPVQGGRAQDSSGEEDDESTELPSSVSDDDVDPLTDPNSLQTTISSLFPHDQLQLQQKRGKAFQDGWREGHISFLPTYKYDLGRVAMFDSSEKHRGPSWCDRILYRTRQDRLDYERREKEALEAKKKDEEMTRRGLDKAAADDAVLFDYDPSTDGADHEDQYDPNETQAQSDGGLFSDTEGGTSDPIHLEYYCSCQGILSSDHKPLEAVFTLNYDSVVSELKAQVHQEVVRELDKAENESRPDLTVLLDEAAYNHSGNDAGRDSNVIDFGDIAYDIPASQYLTVANTSGVPATFCFAKTPSFVQQPLRTMSSWLDIQVELRADNGDAKERHPPPGEHTLFPGELATVQVTAHVKDINRVRVLNYGETKLEEILVLQVTGGRDHFIPVQGNWLSTCFGRSVDDLTHMPEEGARTLEPTTEAWSRQKKGAGARLSAPRELFRLTETISELTERAVAEWSMTKSGSDEETSPPWTSEPHGTEWPFARQTWILQDYNQRAPLLASVRKALDTNKPLTNIFPLEVPALHRLEILSETLLTFLHSLSDGIVTIAVWQKLEQEMIAREKAKMPPLTWEQTQAWVLENLAYSPAHSVSFTFVTFMLAHIANEVAPVLSGIRPRHSSSSSSSTSASSGKKKRRNSSWDKQRRLSSAEQLAQDEEQKQQEQQEQQQKPSPPPATTAAFISAGSFRRRYRSGTSPSVSSFSEMASTSLPSGASNTALARRETVEAALASMFSYYLISPDVRAPSKDKEKRVWEARKRSIIEPFLKTLGVDTYGPSGGR